MDLNPSLERVEISNYGEIFLNPELLQILEYAHGKGVVIAIDNGANLNNVRDEVLEALVKYQVTKLTCSIDGASPETYRVYRVRGDFDRVMKNITAINAHKREYGSELPHLVWQFVVFGHNEHELPMARALAARLGMEFRPKLSWDAKFSPVRNKDFVRAHTDGQQSSRDEFEAVHGVKYVSNTCHQLWDDPQINWDGDVLGCCRNFWGDFGGNAFSEGLIPAINSEKMTYARDAERSQARP